MMSPPAPQDFEEILAVLAHHPFFAGLSVPEREELASCAVRREFPAGQPIIHEGEPARGFYALVHGKVAIQLNVPVRGRVTLQTIADGEVLGWSWMTPGAQWSFDARTQQPTVALEFDGPAVLKLCEAEPRLGYRLMTRLSHVMAERLHATRVQLLDIYGVPRP